MGTTFKVASIWGRKGKIGEVISMKLLYVTNARIPTEKAHGVQIVKMCEAFQCQGVPTELIVPFRIQSQTMKQVNNLWTHYEVETPFCIRYMPNPDLVRFGDKLPKRVRIGVYYLQCFIFSTLAILLKAFQPNSVFYSRNLQTIFLLCLTRHLHRKKIYFEAHELHGDQNRTGGVQRLYTAIIRWVLQHIDGLIVITHRLKALYIAMGMNEQHILVAPDAIDKKRLSLVFDKFEARQKLQIPLDRKIICYTGHLFQWKGVYTLAESVRYFPDDYLVYIVGGMESDLLVFQTFVAEQHLKNIVITGYVPYADIPIYLGAADVLVLPNTSQAKISREYTSPLKLFEYMGARRPIVASDLPSIREVLRHKENAYLVEPDNPKMLAEGILRVMNDSALSERITHTAYTEIQSYTWDERALKIIEFLQRML